MFTFLLKTIYLYKNIIMNTETKKQLIVTIDSNTLESYKLMCKSKGYNMSQRIRNFIETELNDESK